MSIRIFLAALCFNFTLISSALADDKAYEQQAIVDQILSNNNTQSLITLIAQKLSYEILESIRSGSDNEPSEDFIKLVEIETKTAVYEDFVKDNQFNTIFYELYDEYFTLAELKSILAFQSSEAGKKLKQYTTHIDERSFQLAKEKAALTGQKINQRLMDKLGKIEEKINEK
jgi:hypothetical protein